MDFLNMTASHYNHTTDDIGFSNFYVMMHRLTGLFLFPIVCFFGLPANVISVVVWTRKDMRSSTSICLMFLAIADSIQILNDIFYFIRVLFIEMSDFGTDFFDYILPYAQLILNASIMSSAWITVFLALERYIFVCHATKAKLLCTVSRAVMISSCTTVISFLLSIPYVLKYERIPASHENLTIRSSRNLIISNLWQNENFEVIFNWLNYAFRSAIPLVLIFSLSACILKGLYQRRLGKGKRRAAVTVVMVIVAFFLCHIPDCAMSTVFRAGNFEASFLVRGIREITNFLLLLNTASNFVFYCIFNKLFIKSIKKMFCLAEMQQTVNESRCVECLPLQNMRQVHV